MDTQTFRAMGSQINAIWDSSAPPPTDWYTLPTMFEEWEQCLSRFRPDSELSRLNRNAGQPMVVSAVVAEVLAATRWARAYSDGLVLPTLLPQIEATGYTRDFRTMLSTPTDITVISAPQKVYRGDFSVDTAQQLVTVPPGVQIEVGGVAKGWAVDKLARRFGVSGPVLIEIGGDIAVSGQRANGSPWAIAVTNPLTPADTSPLALVLLSTGGIATSGRDYRRWQVGERTFHHIIDPRTGAPAETDVISATIIAPTALEAEVVAKVVLILGSKKGIAWLEQRPALAGLVVCDNGDVNISERWKQYDWAYLHGVHALEQTIL